MGEFKQGKRAQSNWRKPFLDALTKVRRDHCRAALIALIPVAGLILAIKTANVLMASCSCAACGAVSARWVHLRNKMTMARPQLKSCKDKKEAERIYRWVLSFRIWPEPKDKKHQSNHKKQESND